MKLKNLLLSLLITLFAVGQLYAQDDKKETPKYGHNGGFFENIGIGLKAGTYGGGVDVNVSILPNLKARIGFNYLGYTRTIDETIFDLKGDDGTKVDLTIKDISIKFPNANLLLDFYPLVNVPISITGGLYFGQNNIHLNATVAPDVAFEYLEREMKSIGGKLSGDINIGGTVKPYLGLGFGRTIAKRKIGFRCDLGAIYQGDIMLDSDNISGGPINLNKLDSPEISNGFKTALEVLRFYPILSLSLSYRIF
jgi:hypothetical protein